MKKRWRRQRTQSLVRRTKIHIKINPKWQLIKIWGISEAAYIVQLRWVTSSCDSYGQKLLLNSTLLVVFVSLFIGCWNKHNFLFQATTPVEPKLGSPFYAEPADAIKQAALKRRDKQPTFTSQPSIRNRHSDPTSLHQWPPAVAGGGILERIDSKEELITNGSFSSSVDNLVCLRKSRRSNGSIAAPAKNSVKPVEPPKIGQIKSKYNDATWAVDSSWEFIGKWSSFGFLLSRSVVCE